MNVLKPVFKGFKAHYTYTAYNYRLYLYCYFRMAYSPSATDSSVLDSDWVIAIQKIRPTFNGLSKSAATNAFLNLAQSSEPTAKM